MTSPGNFTTGRLEVFSDAVFAIAITLLVLDVRVPAQDGGALAQALAEQWPHYAAHAVSFLTIAIVWVNHHTQFTHIARADRTLLFANLLLLFWVAFIPFPTALVADYLRAGGGDARVAAVVYTTTLELTSVTFLLLWRHARRAGLLAENEPPDQVGRLIRRNMVGQTAYLAGILLAVTASAAASVALCAAAAFYFVHPGRRTLAAPSAEH